MGKKLIVVSSEDQPQRLDLFLSSKLSDYSRSHFTQLIEKGLVTINGKEAKKREIPTIGDQIEITYSSAEPHETKGEDISLSILYEDQHLVAINKPQGFVVHPAPGHFEHTLVNALIHRYKELENQNEMRFGLVHRLDKDTSGVILVAKNLKTHELLSKAFKERTIKKTYLALALGNPGNKVVHNHLGRCQKDRKKFAVTSEGKEALSEIKVLSFKQGFSFVEITPHTGRTHQIRVHLAYLGCPIVGDPLYGSQKLNKDLGLKRQLLHAKSLELLHPITNETLRLEAPLPEEFSSWKKSLLKE